MKFEENDHKKFVKGIMEIGEAIDRISAAVDFRKLGDTLRKQREFEKAIEAYNKSIELYPSAEAYNNCGVTYMYMQNLDQAISFFTKAMKHDSNYIKPYLNRREAYRQQGRYFMALKDLFLHWSLLVLYLPIRYWRISIEKIKKYTDRIKK